MDRKIYLILLYTLFMIFCGCKGDNSPPDSSVESIIQPTESIFTQKTETEITSNDNILNNMEVDVVERCLQDALKNKTPFDEEDIISDTLIYDVDLDGNDEVLVLVNPGLLRIHCYKIIKKDIIYCGYIEYTTIKYAFSENILSLDTNFEVYDKLDVRWYKDIINNAEYPVICGGNKIIADRIGAVYKIDLTDNNISLKNVFGFNLEEIYEFDSSHFKPFFYYYENGKEYETDSDKIQELLDNLQPIIKNSIIRHSVKSPEQEFNRFLYRKRVYSIL